MSGGTLNAQPGSQAITPRDHTRPKAAAAGQRHFAMKTKLIAAIIVAACAAVTPASAIGKDAATVEYVKASVPVSYEEAMEAVLSDVDEFVGDAEQRIKRLHSAALSHRGNAIVYSAAAHRLAAEGDCTGAADLANVSRVLLTLAREEDAAAAAISELLTVVMEYAIERKIGTDPCGVTTAGTLAARHDSVRARVEDAVIGERHVTASSEVVESLVEKTRDSLKLGLGLLKADKG